MAQRKKACKESKLIVDASVQECPISGSTNFTTIFQGRVSVIDANKSQIAKRMGFNHRGDYAIKVRG